MRLFSNFIAFLENCTNLIHPSLAFHNRIKRVKRKQSLSTIKFWYLTFLSFGQVNQSNHKKTFGQLPIRVWRFLRVKKFLFLRAIIRLKPQKRRNSQNIKFKLNYYYSFVWGQGIHQQQLDVASFERFLLFYSLQQFN